MSNSLLFLNDALVSFGGAPLFKGLSFHLYARDKVCLVGRNGCGKSTLLKVIAGEVELDGGERYVKPGTRIGYLSQSVVCDPNETVYDYVLKGIYLQEGESLDDKRYLVDQVLEPLKIRGEKVMGQLSGGKQRRAALARTLVGEPEILLLDEPTNHLDISGIEWLEGYVRSYQGAMICISHDRAFLEAISDKTFWLDRGALRISNKGFSHFESWSMEVMEQEMADLERMGKKLETENLWLAHGVTARRKRNQKRLKELFQLREQIRAERVHTQKGSAVATLPPLAPGQAGKMVVEMKDVSHAFHDVDPPKQTLNNLTLRIMQGEKIAVMGRNGAGKTTFLRLLTGDLKPTTGNVRLGKTATICYIDQKRESLNPQDTLWETLCPKGGDMVKVGDRFTHVISYLKDFLFDPAQAKTPVSSLSGGEANRLLLAKMLADPGNFLILDEPTNDLDMDTLDMLQELLSDYKGTLIIVSHDRDFVERLATRTLVFEGGGRVEDFVGGYTDYLAVQKAKKTLHVMQDKQKAAPQETVAKAPSSKLSYKIQRELELLPAQVEQLAEEVKTLEIQMEDTGFYARDPEGFNSTMQALEEKRKTLSDAEDRWLELEALREETESRAS